MTARCSNGFCNNRSLRNSELCAPCFKNPRMPVREAPRSSGFFDPGPVLLTGGSDAHTYITGPAEGSRLVFQSDGDITMDAAGGHDTFIQGVSVFELEQKVLVQADRISSMEIDMAEMRQQLERAIAIGHESASRIRIVERERAGEKAAEEMAPPGLAGMLARTLTARRKTYG